jgi:hypothetical protein
MYFFFYSVLLRKLLDIWPMLTSTVNLVDSPALIVRVMDPQVFSNIEFAGSRREKVSLLFHTFN